jgi:hypothetical protein
MRKFLLLFLFIATSNVAVNAQISDAPTPVNINMKGEKTITLCGTVFPVVLDDIYGTAKIEDNKTYRIETRDFTFLPTRRFKKVDKSKTLIIPSKVRIGNFEYTVIALGRGVFAGFYNIESIEIPNTITSIENHAFYFTSLKSVVIPSSVEYIGDWAFARSSFKSLVLPSSVEYIGKNAFAKTSLKEVVIPSELKTLGDSAFYKSDLESVELKSSIENVGKDVFKDCKRIAKVILPNPNIPVDNLFAKSEKIYVEYKEWGNNIVAVTPAKKKKKKEKEQEKRPEPVVYAKSSDVDINIPSTGKSNDNMFAIIIANEDYEHEVKVECAHNDGHTFLNYCKSTLGIPETNIRYMEDATSGNMTGLIDWIVKVANVYGEDARILFYYAGHGIPDESNGAAYLLPTDVSGKNVSGAYKLSRLYATLGALPAKDVTVFIDACFSGSRRGNGMLASARGVAIKAKNENPTGKMVVFSAAKDDETAFPYAEKGHGLFTYYLLKKLQETEGNVDYGTLGDYINKEVSRRSIVVNNKLQTPTISPSPQMGENWKKLKLSK